MIRLSIEQQAQIRAFARQDVRVLQLDGNRMKTARWLIKHGLVEVVVIDEVRWLRLTARGRAAV